MTFSGLAPSKLIFFYKSRVGYAYIEESFDTIFNMGYGLWVGKIAHGREG